MYSNGTKYTDKFIKEFSEKWNETIKPFKPIKQNYYMQRDSHTQSIVKGRSKNVRKKKCNNIII